MTSIADQVQAFVKTIPLGSVASIAAAATPPQTKRRAAVVAHDAYAAIDGYLAAKPTLFYSGLLVTAGGVVMAIKRRKQGPEAIASWLVAAGIGATTAYLTRPQNEQAGATAGVTPALATVNAWLDARASQLDRTEPGWDQRALARLLG
jgi:hypothetical protein